MMELVTGGSGSGKSAYAEERICALHRSMCERTNARIPLFYIADMIPFGRETEKKIEKHRRQRSGRGFTTLEWYTGLPEKLADNGGECPGNLSGACVLLECISNLTANEMYEPGGAGADTVKSIVQGVKLLKDRCRHLVVVTNDVFRGSGPDSREMERYKKNLGEVNRELARMAEQVTEVVCGLPVHVKYPAPEKNNPAGMAGKASKEKGRKMILITGGAYQKKLDFAKQKYGIGQWTDGADCALDEIRSCRAMDHFHQFIRRWLEAGKTQEDLTERILNRVRGAEADGGEQPPLIFICDEVGCGLVPVEAFERQYRETAGRICAALAEQADQVYRVVCGIGQRLK